MQNWLTHFAQSYQISSQKTSKNQNISDITIIAYPHGIFHRHGQPNKWYKLNFCKCKLCNFWLVYVGEICTRVKTRVKVSWAVSGSAYLQARARHCRLCNLWHNKVFKLGLFSTRKVHRHQTAIRVNVWLLYGTCIRENYFEVMM